MFSSLCAICQVFKIWSSEDRHEHEEEEEASWSDRKHLAKITNKYQNFKTPRVHHKCTLYYTFVISQLNEYKVTHTIFMVSVKIDHK